MKTQDHDDWEKLAKAAQNSAPRRDMIDAEAPYGFSTRVVASAFAVRENQAERGRLGLWKRGALIAAAGSLAIATTLALLPGPEHDAPELVITPLPELQFPEL